MKQKTLFIFLILTLLSTNAYAETILDVYTWGYGDVMAKVMEVMSTFMGYNSYNSLVKITLLISTFVIFLSLLSDRGYAPWVIIQKVLLVVLVNTILVSDPVTVNVIDKQYNIIGASPVKKVEKVSKLIAYPLWMLSQIENSVKESLYDAIKTNNTDKAIDDLNGTSIIAALNLFQTGINLRINDTNFIKTYTDFMDNCLLPEIYEGRIDIATIDKKSAKTFMDTYVNETFVHPARITMEHYKDNATMITCKTAAAYINDKIQDVTTSALKPLLAGLHSDGTDAIYKAMGTIGNLISSTKEDGQSLLKSSMMVNMFNDSYVSVANSMGIDTGGLAYSAAKAQETARLNASMQAIMAKKYLPVAKGYLTVIFVAIIPILMLIALGTNSFIKPFAMIFGILIALSLWGVGEQLLDFIIYVKMKSMMDNSGLFKNIGGEFSLPGLTFTDAAITETLTLSLGMYWMIPTLAFSIATLSGYAASSMMSGISGIANTGVSSAASEAAGGNISMGNIRMNNVNMNKYDATQAWSGGSANKLSMDNQQTASNQSSIRVGDEYSTKNIDETIHKGSTWITDSQTGKLYEVNGTFDQTGGSWSGKGIINEYDKNGKFIGSYNGELTGTGNMADYQKNVRKGGHGGMEDAFLAQSVVSRNLDASDKVTDNVIRENNNITQNNTIRENKHVEDTSSTITSGNKINTGEEVNGYTGGLAMLNQGLGVFNNMGNNKNMNEAFIQNMTEYQNSILKRDGTDGISETQALAAAGAIQAQAGIEIFGTGASASIQAKLSTQIDHNSGQTDTASLNRIMNTAVLDGLNNDAQANNWTTEQYNTEAQKRFGALNDALRSEAVGQIYGPGNLGSEVINAGKAVGNMAGNSINKIKDKVNDLGEEHLSNVTNKRP